MSGENKYLPPRDGEAERPVDMLDDITRVFDKWSNPRSNRDRRVGAISSAIAEALRNNDLLREACLHMVEFHSASPESHRSYLPTITTQVARIAHQSDGPRPLPYPQYGANLIHRGLWHSWRQNGSETGWPDKFRSIDHCRAAINYVTGNPDLLEDFTTNISWRPIQTSYQDRMVGPLMTLEAYRDRFAKPINMVSIGHSTGLGEKKLLLDLKFPVPQIYGWHGMTSQLESDINLQKEIGERIGAPLAIKAVYGIDIMPGDLDPASREWAVSSLTPSEQMNKKFMDEVRLLSQTMPKGMLSMRGDFTKPQSLRDLETVMEGQADIVLFGTVWYQLTPEERLQMLKNSFDILGPSGLVLVQDFAEWRPDVYSSGNPIDQLYFPADWSPWSYRMHVVDPRRTNFSVEGAEFELMLSFSNGRCSSAIVSDGFKERLFGQHRM